MSNGKSAAQERTARVAEAERFLAELGRGISPEWRVMAGYAEEATVQTDASGKKVNAGWWPVPWKEGKYVDGSKNCYACISASKKTRNPKTGEERYWRGEASFAAGLALMVDDIGDGKGSKGGFTLEYFCGLLQPTAIVETSPGNYQLWYFLEEPELDMRKFKSFLVGFVGHVLDKGGDNTIKDVSRYGRMPCGVNNKRHSDGTLKYDNGDGKPFNVRITRADYDVRYTVEHIAAVFGFAIVVPEAGEKREVDDNEWEIDRYWMRRAGKLLEGQGEGASGAVNENMSGKFRIRCPWGEEHTNGDPYGAYFRGPIPGADVDFVFGCGHDTCRKDRPRKWAEFVDKVVMPDIVDRLQEANDNDVYWPKCKGVARFIYAMKESDYI